MVYHKFSLDRLRDDRLALIFLKHGVLSVLYWVAGLYFFGFSLLLHYLIKSRILFDELMQYEIYLCLVLSIIFFMFFTKNFYMVLKTYSIIWRCGR